MAALARSPPPAPAMPERYLCPITTEIMVDPVMDLHGHNFERSAIAEWLGRSEECPLSREPIHLDTLYPNLALKEEIAEWLARSHPMFGADDTVSSSSSTTSLGDSLPSLPTPSEREEKEGAAPWERVDVEQDYYDRLLALFLSLRPDAEARVKLEALCRYMNFTEALDHLDELGSGAVGRQPEVAFEDFMAFIQKYPPRPVLEYGLSEGEYADVLQKFQALDVDRQGTASREAVLALVEDPRLGCSAAEVLRQLPEGALSLHAFLGGVKRCRLLVARRCSVLTPAMCPLGVRTRGAPPRHGGRTPPRGRTFGGNPEGLTMPGGLPLSPRAGLPRSRNFPGPAGADGVAGCRSPRGRPLSGGFGPGVARPPSPNSVSSPPRARPPAAPGLPPSQSDSCLQSRRGLRPDGPLGAALQLNLQRLGKEPLRPPASPRPSGPAPKGPQPPTPRPTAPPTRLSLSPQGPANRALSRRAHTGRLGLGRRGDAGPDDAMPPRAATEVVLADCHRRL